MVRKTTSKKKLETLRKAAAERAAYLASLDPMSPERRLSAYDNWRMVRK